MGKKKLAGSTTPNTVNDTDFKCIDCGRYFVSGRSLGGHRASAHSKKGKTRRIVNGVQVNKSPKKKSVKKKAVKKKKITKNKKTKKTVKTKKDEIVIDDKTENKNEKNENVIQY